MTPCIETTGSRSKHGYGQRIIGGKRYLAHRLAWASVHGDIPPGMCVLHHCDNPPCINVAHLFLGTKGDNNRDRARKGRSAPQHGERNAHAALTSVQVEAIRADPRLHRLIATDYGVSRVQISRIKSGHRWAHEFPK